jgi:hypothetical protein
MAEGREAKAKTRNPQSEILSARDYDTDGGSPSSRENLSLSSLSFSFVRFR